MDSIRFAQEYMCEFTVDGTEYFDKRLVDEAYDETVTELNISGCR
jgi:hypothetical protein